MATIVAHKVTGQHYVLVGTGYSFYKDSRPSFLGGVLFPHQEEGEFRGAAISDEYGVISWVQTIELEVIEVDGIRIGEILKPYLSSYALANSKTDLSGEICPACGTGVSAQEKECPSCGLRLMA
jgi:ribosomal protein S27AE